MLASNNEQCEVQRCKKQPQSMRTLLKIGLSRHIIAGPQKEVNPGDITLSVL